MPFTTFDHGGYSIKNLKMCNSRDGYAFSASLYLNGKKVGFVTNAGVGGPNEYRPHCPKGSDGKAVGKAWREMQASLVKQAKVSVPKYADSPEVEDIFIEQIVNDFENEKRFKRLCKKATYFRCKGDKEGSYRKLPRLYTPIVADWLRTKAKEKGEEVEEILNETVS